MTIHTILHADDRFEKVDLVINACIMYRCTSCHPMAVSNNDIVMVNVE
jgi:hypothetical protein